MTADRPEAPTSTCDLCCRPVRYRFGVAGGGARRCLRHALVYQPVVRRAIRVALVIGTVLFVINQADVALRGDLTFAIACKIVLTYLVPYSVSTYSALQINHV